MLQVFVPNVLSVFSDACCNCVYLVVAYVPHMLHVFYLDVAYGCNGFHVCFRYVFQVFHKHVSNVSTAFRHMLQSLYLDVSKVDRVLHLSFPHLLLHRLSQNRQGIRTDEGWAMDTMGAG